MPRPRPRPLQAVPTWGLLAVAAAPLLVLAGAAGVLAAPGQPGPAFTAGEGVANARLASVDLVAGSLHVSVLVGDAESSYLDRSAAGQGTSVGIPALGVAGGLRVCGQTGFDVNSALPAPVQASTAANGDTAPVSADGGQSFLHQSVRAEPGARATTTLQAGSLPIDPLVAVQGSTATSEVVVDPTAQARTAQATTEMAQVDVLGGVVSLRGLRWEVEQTQIGPDHRNDERSHRGSFSVGSIAVGLPSPLGLPPIALELPVRDQDDLPGVVAQANQLLAPLGIELRLPTVTEDLDISRHGVSPLTIALGGDAWLIAPPLRAILLGPEFGQLQEQLFDTMFDAVTCDQLGGLMQPLGELNVIYNSLGRNASLVLAIMTRVLAGNGEVAINLGGVTTSLDNRFFEPPEFALDVPPPAPPVPPSPTPPPVPAPPPPAPPQTDSAVAAPAPPPPVAPVQPVLVSSERCETTSLAGRPRCWDGLAPAAGLLAGATAVGLLAGDELYRRRRSRAHESVGGAVP